MIAGIKINNKFLLPLIAFFIVYPFMVNEYWLSIGNQALITIVGASSLMILTGFAGQISLGHAAFFAIGAYTAAILGNEFRLPYWILLPLAGSAAAFVGLMIAPFALRLKGVYLAIVTLGLIYIINHILLAFPGITRGVSGISAPMYGFFTAKAEGVPLGTFSDSIILGPVEFSFTVKLYFLFLFLTIVTLIFTRNLQRSNLGRAMMALRDHDLAAAAMGIKISKTKIYSLIISSFFAGIGGAMFAFQQQFITIDPPFNLQMSIEYIAIIVIGGMGTVFGAIWGSLIFVYLAPIAEIIGSYIPYVNRLSNDQQSILIFSIFVGIILLLEPRGIFGIWQRIKRDQRWRYFRVNGAPKDPQ